MTASILNIRLRANPASNQFLGYVNNADTGDTGSEDNADTSS